MEKIALYRKYRPYNFENLVGQDHVKTTLINAIKTSHVSHAYLFSGPRGTGKTSTARLLSKALNCKKLVQDYEPCGKCEFCTDIGEGKFIDLIEIDAASNRGIDEVRDLNEKIRFAPSRGEHKVYIIDEVHMMTKEAFNALLKTLEEPPSHAFFILATTEIHKIPETIISRCQRFDFKRITEKAIQARLGVIAQKEKVEVEDKALVAISRYVDGGLRDAIGLFEQLTVDNKITFDHVKEILGISDHDLLNELYEKLDSGDSGGALELIHSVHDQGSDLKQFVHEFLDSLRVKMLESVKNGNEKELSSLVHMIDVFRDAEIALNTATIPQLPLEIAVVRIAGNVKRVEIVEKKVIKKKEVADVNPVVNVVERVHKPISDTSDNSVESDKEISAQTEPSSAKYFFDLETLKEKWPRVTERIQIPSLKMSLRSSLPAELDDKDLTLQFNTNFHKNKTMEHDNRVELERVIEELFGAKVKILAIVKELEIKPVKDEVVIGVEEGINEDIGVTGDGGGVTSETDEYPKESELDRALNIFGGEVV